VRRRRRFASRATRRRGLLPLTLVTVFAAAIGITCYATNLFASLDGSTIDGRFAVRGTQLPPKNEVIIAFDSKSYKDLNGFPVPRSDYAQLINALAPEHPAAIVFDIDLEDASTIGKTCHLSATQKIPCDDRNLLNTLSNHPGLTVFDSTQPNANGNGEVLWLGYPEGTTLLKELGSQAAVPLFPTQTGGVDRKMFYSVQNVPTLYVAAAELATHRHISHARFGGQQWIDYPGAQHTIPWLSFSSVINPKKYGPPYGWSHPLPPNYFRGKIVFVGVTQLSLEDYHATSTDPQMAGVEIEADATATILQGFPLRSAPGWVNIALIVLLAAAVPLASLRLGPVPCLGLTVGLAGLLAIGTQVAFDSGKVTSFVYPLGTLILSAAGALSVQLVSEAFERARTRDLFSRFVPENVVDEVLASADGLRLGGVQRDGTVMFTDLRGFTSFSETLTPARVIDVLNRYLSEMSDAIMDHGGTLVAYMGDGIFAVFGAPLVQEDHADRALATAREMLGVRLPRFNAWLREEGLGDGFRMGIGLNSGHVMSGHVGSERRVEYAAVGDTTNTASRIEGLTKGTPYQLLLSDATRAALVVAPEDLVFVDETEIRGREARMKLWSVTGEQPEVQPQPLQTSGPAV
jgi:adenylate cyclase